ncbi:MAG TPA: DUF4056 domain-containing protein [Anaerohalosphaeraceae bacterium]|nr:DUF4056 domain-containing protein [Anaerohalosphaeraceae bacterium]
MPLLIFDKRFYLILLAAVVPAITGCRTSPKLSQRVGAFFGCPLGMEFPEPDELGNHQYNSGWSERNGMVYTCRGGFIDIAHLRESADRTRYLYEISRQNLIEGRTDFSFQMIEPSIYTITIHYPEHWANLSPEQKQVIADMVSIRLGQYLAHTSTVWHEIVTWFGFASVAFLPEHPSSFSWEDTYSDLLGTRLAAQALENSQQDFDSVLTELINRQMQELCIQSAAVAELAEHTVKEKWFHNDFYFLIRMNKRNFDTGDDDGFITPWLIPGICTETEPLSYPVPDLNFASQSGFRFEVEMKPSEKERTPILAIIYPDGSGTNLQPENDFPAILQYIEEQAREKYGPEVDVPRL